MICPECGRKADHKKTSSRNGGLVWRRYACSVCDIRFSTYEMYKRPGKNEVQHRIYSMPCPVCNGYTNIIESRLHTDGSYRRRRVCTECGIRFSTTEKINKTKNINPN